MTGGLASFLALPEQDRRDGLEATATCDRSGHARERDPTVTSLI